jgi:hypothetical protein
MPELAPETIILSRHLDLGERKTVYERLRRGELVQLHRGAYVESSSWRAADPGAQHRARALAVAVHFDDALVFSHLTAAALWRLPRMGTWPLKPHVAGPRGAASHRAAFVRHGLGIPDVVETIDGLRVTGLGSTLVDVAATVGFAHAVAIADAALRRNEHPITNVPRSLLSREHLVKELARVPASHGAVKASRVVEFADGRADRPGESMSRVSMHLAGVTPPELQVSMLGASGKAYDVDFWWKDFNVIGEFDGKWKYTDPRYMAGRSAQQVHYDEKLREDDLRAARHGFSRWPWATAISPTLLRSHLARAGVR